MAELNSNDLGDWREKKHSIKARLSYALSNDDICQDVIFLVGKLKVQFRAHSFILHLGSQELELLLKKHGNHEHKNYEIPLVDADPEGFRYFLEYLYTDSLDFEPKIAMDVLYLAKKFNMPHLVSYCTTLQKADIKTDNAIRIHEFSRRINAEELAESAADFIYRNADVLFTLPSFLDISYESLCMFVQCDALNIDEVQLFNNIIWWAKNECKKFELDETGENLRYVLKKIVNLIRYPLMGMRDFTLHVVDTNVLLDKELLELYRYFSLDASAIQITSSCFITSVSTLQRNLEKNMKDSGEYFDRSPCPTCGNKIPLQHNINPSASNIILPTNGDALLLGPSIKSSRVKKSYRKGARRVIIKFGSKP